MPDVREKLVEQKIKGGADSICPKCFHSKVCRARDNQPCVECNQFVDANGVTIQRWIPVEEQVPEELKNVLAYTAVGSFAETAHWTGYRWEKTWDFEVLYGVTHWMPLPEPPKEERS